MDESPQPAEQPTQQPQEASPKPRKRRFFRIPDVLRSQVLSLVDQGLPNRSIAKQLPISESSVRDIIRARTPPEPVKCRTCGTPVTATDELGDCLQCKLLREPTP